MLENYKRNIYACSRCGICREKYTDTVRYVCPVREHTGGFESSFARGRMQIARGILEGDLTYSKALIDSIGTCLLCGNCREQCGAVDMKTGKPLIDPCAVTRAMRVEIFNEGLSVDVYRMLSSRISEDHNPLEGDRKKRVQWADGLSISRKADLMLFIGCNASYRKAYGLQGIPKSTVKILEAIEGGSFGILEDEWCCGHLLMQIGSIDLAREMAEHNIQALKDARAKKVVCICPGCYQTIKTEYPELIGELPFEVLHLTEFLNDLIEKGEVKLKKSIDLKVTYHDPCNLGREMGIYDEPRNIIKRIPGLSLLEMIPTRNASWCCGSGGGVKASNPELAVEIGTDRVNQATETGAQAIITTCPSCKANISEAIRLSGTKLDVYDLSDLIGKSL